MIAPVGPFSEERLELPRRRLGRHRQVRRMELADPTRERLEALGRELGLDRGLVRQLQDATLAPGLVHFPGWLLARLDVPVYEPDVPLEWKRVDVLVGRRTVVTLSPSTVDVVPAARERWAEPERLPDPSTLLVLITSEIVQRLDGTLSRFHRHYEHLTGTHPREGEPLGMGETLDRLGVQTSNLGGGIRLLESVLTRLEERQRWRLLTTAARGELLALRDRLVRLRGAADALIGEITDLAEHVSGTEGVLDSESPRIVEVAATVGERRLARLTWAHAVTALIGGMAVSFGSVAMASTAGPFLAPLGPERAHFLGALAFPLGFVFLIVGKGELFTENFFVPVTSVFMRRAGIGHLLLLWGMTLLFNIAGGALFAVLITRRGVLAPEAAEFLRHLSLQKTHQPFWTQAWRSVFAGWLMTVLTWLMMASRRMGPRLVCIWCVGFLLVAAHFNHVVISACEIFMGIGLGAPITLGDWLGNNFWIAVLGNLAGGVVFVTIVGYLQAHAMRAGTEREEEALRQPAPPRVPPRRPRTA